MNQDDLKNRTRAFALGTIGLVEQLPRTRSVDIIARQLVRSATSVGANYRSACRAKSRADFIAKMAIVEEESDESIYWLELLRDAGFGSVSEVPRLLDEAHQLTAIIVSSIRTARRNRRI